MAAKNDVKWDLDSLSGAISSLSREQGNMRSYRNTMAGLKGTVAANWRSPAATQYLARLDSDISALDIILSELEEQIQALRKVLDNCYRACENTVQSGLRSLGSAVR